MPRARASGAWVVTPPTFGVGLLELHQLDQVVRAGRAAARALLEEAGDDLLPRASRSPVEEAGATS